MLGNKKRRGWALCFTDQPVGLMECIINHVEAPGPVPWPLGVPTWDIYNAPGWWSGRASKVQPVGGPLVRLRGPTTTTHRLSPPPPAGDCCPRAQVVHLTAPGVVNVGRPQPKKTYDWEKLQDRLGSLPPPPPPSSNFEALAFDPTIQGNNGHKYLFVC